MTETHCLHVGKSWNQWHHHLLKFFLLPESTHLLSFSVDVFQIKFVVYVFTHDTNPESIVHGLIKEVAIELYNVWMMLRLKQLYRFLLSCLLRIHKIYLIFIQLIERLRFYLLQSIISVRGKMQSLINLGVLLSRTQEVNLLEILLSKHLLFYFLVK